MKTISNPQLLSVVREKEKSIELKTDLSLEAAFDKRILIGIWGDVQEEFPEFSYKAFNFLLPLTIALNWRRGLLRHTNITFIEQNKYFKRHSARSDLRTYLPSVDADSKIIKCEEDRVKIKLLLLLLFIYLFFYIARHCICMPIK